VRRFKHGAATDEKVHDGANDPRLAHTCLNILGREILDNEELGS